MFSQAEVETGNIFNNVKKGFHIVSVDQGKEQDAAFQEENFVQESHPEVVRGAYQFVALPNSSVTSRVILSGFFVGANTGFEKQI